MATKTATLPLLEDAASVLDLPDLHDELVEVPEWGYRLRVRSLTGSERDAIYEKVVTKYGFMTKVTRLLAKVGGVVKRKKQPYADCAVVISITH